ncbi:UNVERIFIED_CONTAM: ATP-dependent (S)-NAD(P)H-hydrate dehydratase [Sesamum latifolium]|uniref:ATP-dependent (S)-NAD(P)H-hydrate dehydratase n=1 Tax=Sesamum latifolium TaxID=2727402 RepID=A0AAW2XVW5_9LAMI
MVGFSAAVIRRQQFLIRCLGGYSTSCKNLSYSTIKMQSLMSGRGSSLEVDAISILKSITPSLDPSKHKGQAGKIAVVGGCREYTGAPYFSAISALKIGADLSHVFCTKDAATVIKSYTPELIVHPILEESYSVRDEDKKSISAKVIQEVDKWMERFDCLVIGPGLGRDPFLLDCVSDIMKHARDSNVPMVIDGMELSSYFLLRKGRLSLISLVYVLVPDELYLFLVRIGGVTILRKGGSDFISNGETVSAVSTFGSPRRCGGQGDILSGSVAVFISWARQNAAKKELSMSPTVLGCIAGSVLLRKAASHAFQIWRNSVQSVDNTHSRSIELKEVSLRHFPMPT